ncbi:MAG: pyruvate dehydrogenase (acetyl-transferring), homodimeric type, partial [Gammaproteobacteria bacterium]
MTDSTRMHDVDTTETEEWLEALDAVIEREGPERAHFLLERLIDATRRSGGHIPFSPNTAYINTIPSQLEKRSPGDHELERKIRALIRWNALAMVVRANKKTSELGGHIASFASAATLYDVGFNHFWRAPTADHGGDMIFFQGHSAPGIYARAFMEGRLSEEDMGHFRQEVDGKGLSSYPHPWLMPDFWQYPTVSMGLGPIQAIYQARFMHYMHNRGFIDQADRKVWAFLGDGEMDEPESMGAIGLAGRERLDNLVFVVNCNLQRLDGPVTGNSKIIQDLEGAFSGAGWRVVKNVWDRNWDPLLASDPEGRLLRRLGTIVDGVWQRSDAEDGAWTRAQLIGDDPVLANYLASWSDDQIKSLGRGGHDRIKVANAYREACQGDGRPTVILAKTVKGHALGPTAASRNVTHQLKKLKGSEVRAVRDLLEIPVADSEVESAPFYHPGENSPEVQYMLERRQQLGGSIPRRRAMAAVPELPPEKTFTQLHGGTEGSVPASTTMAFARLFRDLLKAGDLGKRIVPILADEARTFGMEALFKQVGIYAPGGQAYEPVDHDLLFSYTERKDGQILQE